MVDKAIINTVYILYILYIICNVFFAYIHVLVLLLDFAELIYVDAIVLVTTFDSG